MRRAEVRFFRMVFRLFVLTFVNLTAHPEQVFGANESLPWSFANGADGYGPVAGLTTDSNGNLYGTTASGGAYGGGTVFELSPPTTDGGSWTESILWNFSGGTDGSAPAAGLIIDGSGNLYGTTTTGGSPGAFGVGLGTVFKLIPPAISGRKWTESILWSFGGYPADGDGPKGLALDASGNLFGTTGYGGAYNSGTAFELSPPTTGRNWTEYIIWNFGSSPIDGGNPAAGLIMDSGGNLYGTTGDGGTAGLGTAFELTPPTTSGGNWNESILWNFGNGTDGYVPLAGLTMDPSGNLYGTTAFGGMQGGGTVFGLTPPTTVGGSWNEWLLWNFGSAGDGQNPAAGLLMDSGGHLFGTTEGGGTSGGPDNGGGTVFELTPLSIGAGPWGETILWNFGSGTDGYLPVAGLVMDANGNLYGTTDYGGTYQVNYTGGTVFEISAIAAIPTPTPTVVLTPTPTPTVVSTPTPPPPTPIPPTPTAVTPTPTPMPPPPTPTPPLPTPTPVISVTPAPTPTPLPPGPAAVTMSSRSLAFGNVAYAVAGGAARVRKLTITNPAKYKTAAIISSIVGPAGFSGDPACVNATIPPGGRLACNITYVPTGLGAVGGTLNVSGAPQFIGLSGAGIPGKLTASPGTLNFASVPLNTTSAAQIILLRNRSAVTFTISSITNGNPGFVASKNCVGPLGPLASCAITLSYSPTVTTRETDTLTILDSPDAIARTVNLIGTGH